MKTGTLPTISNQATWRDTVEILDDDTGEPFDITDVSEITIKVRDPDNGSTVLSGSLGGGEIIAVGDDADGTVQFTFAATTMAGICAKTYEVGMLVTDTDDFVSEVILGRVSILKGL